MELEYLTTAAVKGVRTAIAKLLLDYSCPFTEDALEDVLMDVIDDAKPANPEMVKMLLEEVEHCPRITFPCRVVRLAVETEDEHLVRRMVNHNISSENPCFESEDHSYWDIDAPGRTAGRRIGKRRWEHHGTMYSVWLIIKFDHSEV